MGHHQPSRNAGESALTSSVKQLLLLCLSKRLLQPQRSQRRHYSQYKPRYFPQSVRARLKPAELDGKPDRSPGWSLAGHLTCHRVPSPVPKSGAQLGNTRLGTLARGLRRWIPQLTALGLKEGKKQSTPSLPTPGTDTRRPHAVQAPVPGPGWLPPPSWLRAAHPTPVSCFPPQPRQQAPSREDLKLLSCTLCYWCSWPGSGFCAKSFG